MIKRGLRQVLKAIPSSIYRYVYSTSAYGLVGCVINEVHKNLPTGIPRIKFYIQGGCQVVFAKNVKERVIQQEAFAQVLDKFVCWYDETANVWKIEKSWRCKWLLLKNSPSERLMAFEQSWQKLN